MFGRFKPVPFEPYGRRRRGLRIPGWLWLLLFGLAGGAAGVIWAQERWLPPRLSADASERLTAAFQQADADRTRLGVERDDLAAKLSAAQARTSELERSLADARAQVETLQRDLATAVEALPPDPRGGSVAVRAGRFSVRGDQLQWELVLSRAGGTRPIDAVLQLQPTGEAGRELGRAPAPQLFSIGAQRVLRGSAALGEGGRPNQVTVRILDRPGGQSLGMRVMLVQ